jgi:hypothetical protein
MSDGEEYVRVFGTLIEIRKKSFLFAVGKGVSRGAWVPRGLIHGADDKAMDAMFNGQQMAVRIFRWKVEQCGFTSSRDDQTHDLFNERGAP